jgi:acylglycerol lipase
MTDLRAKGVAHGLVPGFPGVPDSWKTSWSTAPSSDGKLNLFSMVHSHKSALETRDRPVKILFAFHGQGEHCGRYQHFPHYLSETVDVIATMDHRGHGRSEGVRGHVDRFEQYVLDARAFVERTRSEWGAHGRKVEIHLFGHSMGGLISLLLLQEHPQISFRSATLSAPLLGLKFEVPLAKRLAGHALSKVLGGLQLDTGLDSSLVSHDPAVVATYNQDTLVHGKATARFFTEMLEAIRRARSRDVLQAETQFLVPLADGLVDPQATLEFAGKLRQSGKRIVTYEGFFHESFNEVQKEKAFADLSKWIQEHS